MSDFLNNLVDWAHDSLLENENAIEYLRSRGSSEVQWRRHLIGFISGLFEPDSSLDKNHGDPCFDSDDKKLWCDTCKFKKWSSLWSDEEKRNVVGGRILDSILYPLTSYSGQIVGVQIRAIKEKRYDTFMRSYRPESYFFGLKPNVDKIWSRGSVILVEGPSDLLSLERFTDIPVLALTTNSTNDAQTRFLKMFAKNVMLCLDTDKAGKEGSHKILDKLGNSLSVSILDYSKPGIKAKDINELWQMLGDEKFSNHLNTLNPI